MSVNVVIEKSERYLITQVFLLMYRILRSPIPLFIFTYMFVAVMHQTYDWLLLLNIYENDWEYWVKKQFGQNKNGLIVIGITIVMFTLLRIFLPKHVKLSKDAPPCFLEKMRPGSELTKINAPSFQATILTTDNKVLGGGFLSESVLYTAWHVVDEFKSVLVQAPLRTVEIPIERFTRRESDIAMCALSESEVSVLGLTSAKLHAYALSKTSGVFAQISGPNSGSIGFVEAHRSFGFVSYDGSTVNGFSGCPYYVGKTVYGMHVGGGSQNCGYEAAYLRLLLKKNRESSEDYLMDLVSKKKSFKYERSPFDPDEFRVVVGDRYFMVDSETLENLQGRASARQSPKVTYENERMEMDEPDFSPDREEEVFRVKPTVDAMVLGPRLAQPVVPRPKPMPRETPVLKFQPDIEASTSGRKLMVAQRKEAFDDMSKFLKMLRQECNDLRQKLLKKQSHLPLDSSENARMEELRQALSKISAESSDLLSKT